MSEVSRLTVLELRRGAKNKHPVAVCLCECGNKRTVRQSVLRRGLVTECGKCAFRTGQSNRPRATDEEQAFARLFDSYQGNARRRGIAFALGKYRCRELFASPCHYCGAAPARAVKAKYRGVFAGQFNGIDRVNNAEGYEDGNVVPCCGQCNYAKRDMTMDEFLSWLDRITCYRAGPQ